MVPKAKKLIAISDEAVKGSLDGIVTNVLYKLEKEGVKQAEQGLRSLGLKFSKPRCSVEAINRRLVEHLEPLGYRVSVDTNPETMLSGGWILVTISW